MPKHFQSLLLSHDTSARRFGEIVEHLSTFREIARQIVFCIQLDEATDRYKEAHFIAYDRFCDTISSKRLLFCKPMQFKATVLALFVITSTLFDSKGYQLLLQ